MTARARSMTGYFVGLMSGTSLDGLDCAIVDFESRIRTISAQSFPLPATLRDRFQTVITTATAELSALGQLDAEFADFCAACINSLLRHSGIRRHQVRAIGHHGQTIFHSPASMPAFSMQIGDPNRVAALTGIDTVADFRRMDIACGGQGAPLLPILHDALFRAPDEAIAVVNVGGIANLTGLLPQRDTIGFDTGPGNTLLDQWIRHHRGDAFDASGQWAGEGAANSSLLRQMLNDPYFNAPPPKSTGREYFNPGWLEAQIATLGEQISATDIQATLLELTARSITDAIAAAVPGCQKLLVCGGGSHNQRLMQRLTELSHITAQSTTAYGVEADWVEAIGFAWLARARILGVAGNVPTVTGARRNTVLGGLYCAGMPADSTFYGDRTDTGAD